MNQVYVRGVSLDEVTDAWWIKQMKAGRNMSALVRGLIMAEIERDK